MKVSFEILELIKKYIVGNATDNERASLEQMVVERPELQEEIDMAKMLMKETENLERERLLEVIQEAHSDENVGKEKARIFSLDNKKIWWVIAASITILLGSIWWFTTQSEEKKLYAFQEKTYRKFHNDDLIRGSSITSNLKNAYLEYSRNNFDKSLTLLEGLSSTDSTYLKGLTLKGHNYYKKGNYNLAIEVFNEILSKKESKNYFPTNLDNVGWTKILAMLSLYNNDLENNKPELKQAISVFLKEANPKDVYAKNAIELKKLID